MAAGRDSPSLPMSRRGPSTRTNEIHRPSLGAVSEARLKGGIEWIARLVPCKGTADLQEIHETFGRVSGSAGLPGGDQKVLHPSLRTCLSADRG